jgi:hypothetical protein
MNRSKGIRDRDEKITEVTELQMDVPEIIYLVGDPRALSKTL